VSLQSHAHVGSLLADGIYGPVFASEEEEEAVIRSVRIRLEIDQKRPAVLDDSRMLMTLSTKSPSFFSVIIKANIETENMFFLFQFHLI
jgi:hypothetical protein